MNRSLYTTLSAFVLIGMLFSLAGLQPYSMSPAHGDEYIGVEQGMLPEWVSTPQITGDERPAAPHAHGLTQLAGLAAGAGQAITLTTTGFVPAVLTVTVGSEVAWTNATNQTYVLRSGETYLIYLPLVLRSKASTVAQRVPSGAEYAPAAVRSSGLFSATLAPGATFTYTFVTTGTFAYHTTGAAWFQGRVKVEPTPSSIVAPPVAPGVATDIGSATEFLYTGDHPIQTGVVSGTIEMNRVAVLRGRVFDIGGSPISDTLVTVLNHPEFGQTLSRLDGMFDLAVNGGGWLSLNYQKSGFLPAQRKLDIPWRDYTWLPDVTLIQADPRVTAIDLTSPTLQVAQGSIVSDTDGMRQATLFIPPGTTATLIFTDGVTQTLSSFHVRMTEYTVGERGPQAMPGELPPQSGYTYAADYRVDEAVAAGALDVVFNQPVIGYLDNFLDFTVGISVPLGYHDRQKNVWVASDNGRVIKLLGITNTLAELDTNGDGAVDDAPTLAALGITDAERTQLANLYPAGKSLWRMPTTHFSAWDANWGTRCEDDECEPPAEPDGQPEPFPDDPNPQCGSLIGCETQVLGEAVDVVGTPFSLHYTSGRAADYAAAYRLRIPLSGSQLPQKLQGIRLSISVAGRQFEYAFPAQPNQSYTFTWDGRDGYGRTLQGPQPVLVDLSYEYKMEYVATGRFGYNGQGSISGDWARRSMGLHKRWWGTLGVWEQRATGLGGWDLDVHHSYAPSSRLLYLGDGSQRSAEAQSLNIVTTVAGNGSPNFNSANGITATLAGVRPEAVAVGPDGSLYLVHTYDANLILQVRPSGIITTVAGRWGCQPDVITATLACIWPNHVAVGLDGDLYNQWC